MEDGATIAYCLKAAGKDKVAAASRSFQEIRFVDGHHSAFASTNLGCSYERVKAVQKTGETTRDMWHKADWDKVKANPESIQIPREDWIHGHDAETHAREVFPEIFERFTMVAT